MLKTVLIAGIVAAGLSGPVFADVNGPNGKIIECFCTDTFGKRRELGDIICLTVGGKSYMAKCIMAQNVPFWRDQKMGCLNSNLNMTPRPTQVASLFPKSLDRFSRGD